MKIIKVVAAIWQNSEGCYFIAQRSPTQSLAGYWEFPGGKVEPGEDETTALFRELREELGVEVMVGDFVGENDHLLEPNVQLHLRAYRITLVSGELDLREHQAFAWVKASNLLNYSLSPADIPIAQQLLASTL